MTAAPARPTLSLRRELARKGIHLLSAGMPVAYAMGVLGRGLLGAALAVVCVIAVAVETARARHERTRRVFDRTAGALLRAHEHGRWSGATWLALSLLGAVALLPPRPVAVAAMWAVCVGDAAAAVFGRAFGGTLRGLVRGASRRASRGAGKSLEGSLACFAAALVGALAVARLPLAQGLVAALAAALAERPARPLDDNVRIVAAVGGSLMLWRVLAG